MGTRHHQSRGPEIGEAWQHGSGWHKPQEAYGPMGWVYPAVGQVGL